jgi:hypothetical protein
MNPYGRNHNYSSSANLGPEEKPKISENQWRRLGAGVKTGAQNNADIRLQQIMNERSNNKK